MGTGYAGGGGLGRGWEVGEGPRKASWSWGGRSCKGHTARSLAFLLQNQSMV